MPFERWSKLGDKAKAIWDTLSDQDKATILGYGLGNLLPPRLANAHETLAEEEEFHDAEEAPPHEEPHIEVNQTDQKPPVPKYPPHDIRSILSQQKIKPATPRQVNMAERSVYRVSNHNSQRTKQSLVDRGSNGGAAGEDVKVLSTSLRTVDIKGIDNHQLTNVATGTVAGVMSTTKGPIVLSVCPGWVWTFCSFPWT